MLLVYVFFFQAEDGIRDLVRSRGLGDVYKRQGRDGVAAVVHEAAYVEGQAAKAQKTAKNAERWATCLLYTSDAADERSSVDLGGRRIIKKKTQRDK